MIPAETQPTEERGSEEKQNSSNSEKMKQSGIRLYMGYIVWLAVAISAMLIFSFQSFYFSDIGLITNTVEPGSICGAFIVSFLCALVIWLQVARTLARSNMVPRHVRDGIVGCRQYCVVHGLLPWHRSSLSRIVGLFLSRSRRSNRRCPDYVF